MCYPSEIYSLSKTQVFRLTLTVFQKSRVRLGRRQLSRTVQR